MKKETAKPSLFMLLYALFAAGAVEAGFFAGG